MLQVVTPSVVASEIARLRRECPQAITHLEWTVRRENQDLEPGDMPYLTVETYVSALIRLDILREVEDLARYAGPVQKSSRYASPLSSLLGILLKTRAIGASDLQPPR